MAAEEDKKFDAVLGGFLASDLRGRAERLHCPEPDVLAAYHERSLLPEEMNSWKEHIVGCARCQAILAELEATDSIPLEAVEKEELLEMQVAGAAVDGAGDRARSFMASSPKPRVTQISRGVRWQWLAPVGALAAGMLIWVAWHENQRPQSLAVKNDQIAKVEPSSTPPLSSNTRQSSVPSSSDETASLSKDSPAIGGLAREKKLSAPESRKQQEKFDSFAKAVPSKTPADKETGARRDVDRERAELDSLAAAKPAQSQPSLDNKGAVAGAATETVQIQTQAANNAMQNQLNQVQIQNQANAQRVHGPNPPAQSAQSKKAKSEESARAIYHAAAPSAAPPPAPAGAAAYNDVSVSSGLIAGKSTWHLISAPGAKSLWRVGPGGFIAFSNDGGASWVKQKSDALVELTAGSAPSDKVCWLVGRSGTVLLTLDSGTLWTVIQSPLDEDLAGIRATDERHAIVWTSGNAKTFETFDSGVTWKPVPPPQ